MSKSGAYYNEFDPKAAAWLRELIKRGLIADGEVDERSIIDVAPDDVRGFTQCHWFAGVGGWSRALRLAGWPDDEPVWTGSPPCQPFSAAGQQRGSADERHLAPHFAELIASVRPTHVFGEQVASAAVFGKPTKGAGREIASQPEWAWIDDLFGRLEAAHYACGASDIPAAGVGAPHLLQRTFFVGVRLADASGDGSQRRVCGRADSEWQGVNGSSGRDGTDGGLADSECFNGRGQHERRLGDPQGARESEAQEREWLWADTADGGAASRLGHPGRPAGQRDAGAVSGTQAGEHGAWVAVDGDQPVGPEHAGAGVGGLEDAGSERCDGQPVRLLAGKPRQAGSEIAWGGATNELEHPAGDGREPRRPEPSGWGIASGRGDSGLANTDGGDASAEWQQREREQRLQPQGGRSGVGPLAQAGGGGAAEYSGRPSPLAGGWDNPDWLFCRDGKWRPVESSLFGLADGLPDGMVRGGDIVPASYPLAQKGKTDTRRAMRLKGYGNAIVPQAAAVFIKSVMEITQ